MASNRIKSLKETSKKMDEYEISKKESIQKRKEKEISRSNQNTSRSKESVTSLSTKGGFEERVSPNRKDPDEILKLLKKNFERGFTEED